MSRPPVPESPHDITDAPSLIQHHSKFTLFIPGKMPTPLQGRLNYTDSKEWQFLPGQKLPSTKPPIPLPHFDQGNARQLTSTR